MFGHGLQVVADANHALPLTESFESWDLDPRVVEDLRCVCLAVSEPDSDGTGGTDDVFVRGYGAGCVDYEAGAGAVVGDDLDDTRDDAFYYLGG